MRIVKLTIISLALALVWPAAAAVAGEDAPTVDQIIDNYIAALGGSENLDNLQNLVYRKGHYEEGEYSSDKAAMSVGRPYYKLVGDKANLDDFMEGYDGSAWEYFGSYRIVIRTVGAASEASRHYAGVERPLYKYREKGSSIEYLGETDFAGQPAYVIRLTRRDNFVEQFYFDTKTFMLAGTSMAAPLHAFGPEIETVTRISDYRLVAGVLVPHRFETVEVATGEVQSFMQWGQIEGNADLPEDWFSPPVVDKPPVAKLVEDLYVQRTDFTSMVWTYDEFRLAHPDVDTNEALNIAGYQILKMGQVENAIKLLEMNRDDYPKSAETRFGLGRAYETAGNIEEAIKYYLQTLDLDPEYGRAERALEGLGN